MIMPHRSIKTTLRFSITMFGLLVAACLLWLLVSYAWIVEDNVFNRLVLDEARYIEQQYQQAGAASPPRYPFMRLYPNWQQLPENVQTLHRLSPERVEFPGSDGGTLHIQTVQLGGQNAVLVADVTAFEITPLYLPHLLPWFGLTLALVAGLAMALSYYLSRHIVGPLLYLSRCVEQHRQGTDFVLNQALPANEILDLGLRIQRNIQHLEAALAREADFTRDVSHELRTPATVVKMILSRLTPASPPDEETLNQLRQSITQMEQTIHTLLALAREESAQTEYLGLLEVVEHCLVNHHGLMQQPTLQLQVDIAPGYTLSANRNLLHILLNNVIDNALKHASVAELTIALDVNRLVISNPCQALGRGDVLRVGVKHSESQGIGQGLHIVRRICEHYHWPVEVTTAEGRFFLSINFSIAVD